MRAYADLRPGSDVRGWLVTIAHRKALDVLRSTGRAPVPMEELPHTLSRDGIPEPPDDELRLALAALAPKQRAAVLYHYIAGLPYADVAALIECSEPAARRSAADGIAKLRKSYGQRSTR
jgi:RNA polymerase sigma factor (sigma-70 family)